MSGTPLDVVFRSGLAALLKQPKQNTRSPPALSWEQLLPGGCPCVSSSLSPVCVCVLHARTANGTEAIRTGSLTIRTTSLRVRSYGTRPHSRVTVLQQFMWTTAVFRWLSPNHVASVPGRLVTVMFSKKHCCSVPQVRVLVRPVVDKGIFTPTPAGPPPLIIATSPRMRCPSCMCKPRERVKNGRVLLV